MDLLSLGLQSRKTGIRPKQNLKKDKFQMEDVDEFFAEVDEATPGPSASVAPFRRYDVDPLTDSNESSNSYKATAGSFNNVARRINFTDAEVENYNLSPISVTSKSSSKKRNKKSPLRSPLPEHQSNGLFVSEYDENEDDNFGQTVQETAQNQDFDDSFNPVDNVELSPVPIIEASKKRAGPKKSVKKGVKQPTKSAASLTKKMVLGKTTGATRKRVHKQIEPDDESDENEEEDEDNEKEDEITSPITTTKKRSANSSVRSTPQQIVTRYSPLPSPPPEENGLRRSRRTRIAPLAYWRNERIIYGRAEISTDPDATLAQDLLRVPMQEIEEVVQVPEQPKQPVARPRKRSPPKTKKTTKKLVLKPEDETDLNLNGSEWIGGGSLDLEVFEDDVEVTKTVAFAPDTGDFKQPDLVTTLDNYKVAPLFVHNKDFCASGLIDFPFEGRKASSTSKDSLLTFHVVNGLIEVTLGNEAFNVIQGCSFQVPPDNVFGFKNLGQGSARLFFVQTRVPVNNSTNINDSEDDELW
jgi:centromere protein C